MYAGLVEVKVVEEGRQEENMNKAEHAGRTHLHQNMRRSEY